MKRFKDRALIALHFVTAIALLTCAQTVGALFVAGNPVFTQAVAASYTKVNVSTSANLVALDPKAQEELWVKRVLMGADQENVFADNMIGGPGSGKPFIRYDDLTKVDGNTINVPTLAPLGGPGTQGEGDRIGNEEKLRISSFPVKIGRQWFGVGITDVAMEETVIGSQFDNVVNMLLRKRLGRKKSEDMIQTLKQAASSSNTMRPNFKSTREQLRTADVVSTTTITKAGLQLSGLGGVPVKLGKSKVGADVERFLFFGNQYALSSLGSETAYLQALQYAGERGDNNPLFKGDFVDWNGHGIYRWYLRDHEAYGPVGSVLLPRAFLGAAIVTAGISTTIYGGGDATGSTILPAPGYFEAFSNAPWTYTNGNSVAADTTTDRYLLIMNLSGSNAGKVGFYNYRVNTGNTITIRTQLGAAITGNANTTVGNVVYNTGVWPAAGSGSFAGTTDVHPVGSLIVETNSYGVPFGGSLMLAEMAGICGHGSLKGRNAMGARTEEHRNHGMDHGIGIETVFGSAATKRTDGKTPNYVYVEHAIPLDGLPTVT
jgi:N4-gp56 family major capsid protein